MKAWTGERDGAAPRFTQIDLPRPEPRPGELLVRVRAAGLNRVDQWPKTRHFEHTDHAPAPIPGLEAAGEVVAIGPDVRNFAVGDRVMAMVQGGCAEFVRMKAAIAMPVPADMDWTVAAGIPVSYLTAHDALVTRGGLTRGSTVLVHAVTSGVGVAALQIAKLLGAAFVAGTSGSPEKLGRLATLGLDCPLADPNAGLDAGLADRVMTATAGRGVDIVVDNIGGRLLDQTIRATAFGGRIIDVGRFGGTKAELDLDLLAVRRVSLIGVTFRTRSLDEHAAVVRAFVADHGAHLAAGTLRPIVDRVYPFDALPDAMARSASREQFGKLILAL